jgi:AcrR family transcriptional regulator
VGKVNGRTGRRPGNADTREQILAAAREQFAAKGFRGTTMRSIADAAKVNVALLAHYFGGKAQLFDATLELPDVVRDQMREILSGDLTGAGERLARSYLAPWEESATRRQLLAGVRTALSGDDAMLRMRDVLDGALDGDPTHSHPERRTGLALAMSHLLGVAIARHVSQLAPIAELPFDDLIARVAPSVQLHLNYR